MIFQLSRTPAQEAAGQGDGAVLFAELTQKDWQRLLPMVQTLRFSPGEVLIVEGAEDPAFYILTEGEVTVQSAASDPDAIARLAAPSVFGEVSFFDSEPRSATVRAVSAGAAIRVSRDAFVALSAWEPRIAQVLLMDLGRVLATRLRETTRAALR